MDKRQILQKIINYIVPGITFILGLITKHYFDLFKNKLPRLQYSINKAILGSSGHDNYFGEVKVLYNDHLVENLYLCNINLVNTSNKDFSNLVITVWSDLGSIILNSYALKSNSINPLKVTEDYIKESKNITTSNSTLIWSRRPYNVPVLNRDDRINFSCLVTNTKRTEPNIYLACEYTGLKLEANFIQPQLFWGENQKLSALWGLAITAFLTIPVIYFIQSKIIIAIFVFILGAFCLIPGVLFLKLLKQFNKIIR